jgi:hypothetical protein
MILLARTELRRRSFKSSLIAEIFMEFHDDLHVHLINVYCLFGRVIIVYSKNSDSSHR